jgi:hypothetical protein
VNPGSPGLFDLPGPVLFWLDSRLFLLPDLVRILIWAAIGSAASMALYAVLSPQRRLVAIKARISESQAVVEAYSGDFRGALPLLKSQIGLSLRHVGLTLLPAVVGSLPVLFLIPWLALRFGWALPDPGTPVTVTASPAREDLSWQPPLPALAGPGSWQVSWPHPGNSANLRAADGTVLLTLPLSQPTPVLTKRRWWHLLFGERAGYLPEDAPVESVELGLSRKTMIPGLPPWLAGWEAPFFGGMLLFSIAIKMRYRIH